MLDTPENRPAAPELNNANSVTPSPELERSPPFIAMYEPAPEIVINDVGAPVFLSSSKIVSLKSTRPAVWVRNCEPTAVRIAKWQFEKSSTPLLFAACTYVGVEPPL